MSYVKNYILKNKLTKFITLHGFLSKDEVVNHYIEKDVFILPSWSEGMPNSMIEAMSSKMAVLVSDVGNISDAIINKENGLLCKSKDLQDLISKIKLIILNKELRHKMALNGFNTAKKTYSVENNVSLLINQINNI